MKQKYHFISGLPRSGSTLLTSILKQNPRFHSDITDPLLYYSRNLIQVTHNEVGMNITVPIEKRKDLIMGLFERFYKDKSEVCFNTNRGWTAYTAMVKDLFPESKIIVCIRDIPWILDSFEVLNSTNPYAIKPIFQHQDLLTVYQRVHNLMATDGSLGYVSGPLLCLKQGIFSNEKSSICIIDYDALAKHPQETMKLVYDFIQEPYFNHDFNNVANTWDEFDLSANIKGLHTVYKKVEYRPRKPILPSDLWQQYTTSSFWKYDFDYMKKQMLWIE